MHNVRVKSGGTQAMLGSGVTSTSTGAWIYKDSPDATYFASVTGTGAVTATVVIEVSNDGTNAASTVMGTITLSGTTTAADGFTSQGAPWKWVRARVTAVTGTGATVQTTQGV